MNCVKDEADTQILTEKQSDSSSHDEGSSGQSSPTRRIRVALKKGPWTSAEDDILIDYVKNHGEGNWNAVQKYSGLSRCGKSCRLRWVNHLRPNLKKGGFTPEEEQAVIQLHKRMGNKWARMAALIPGRTDNEIKNFWNTLVKRRHRAGLPLYATVVPHQTSTENQQLENAVELSSGDELNRTVLQGAKHDVPKLHFDPSRANPGPLCYAPSSDIPVNGMLSSGLGSHPVSVTGMLSQGLGSHTSSFLNPGVNYIRQNWESETSFGGYHDKRAVVVPTSEQLLRNHPETAYWNHGLGYPHEPDPCNKNPVSAGSSIPGSHALLNGNFSSSSHPLGAVKLELPSLQYPGYDYGNWCTSPYVAIDAYIQSPGNVPALPGYASPRSNGFLEALVQESQAISCGKKQSYKRTFSPAYSPSDMIQSSISPFSQSAASILNVCNIPMSIASSVGFPPCNAPSGLEASVEQVSTPGVQDMSEPCSPFSQPAASLLNECNIPMCRASFDGFPPCNAPSGLEAIVEQVSTPGVQDMSEPCSPFSQPAAALLNDCNIPMCRATSDGFSPCLEASIEQVSTPGVQDMSEPCSPFSQHAASLLNDCNIPMCRATSDGFPPCNAPFGLEASIEQVSTTGVQDMSEPCSPFCQPAASLLNESNILMSIASSDGFPPCNAPSGLEASVEQVSIHDVQDMSEPWPPFSQPAASLLNDCNILMCRASTDGFPPCNAPSGLQASIEQVSTPAVQDTADWQQPDFLRPDASLESDFFYGCFQNSMDDAIASAFGGEDWLQPPASLDSYEWNSMPCVYQMPEHSN